MRRDFVQAHVEKLLEEITDVDKVEQDGDGDWPFPLIDGGVMWVGVSSDEPMYVWLRGMLDEDVPLSPQLLWEMNEVNQGALFCRCYWDDGRIVLEHELVSQDLDHAELERAFWSMQATARRLRENHLDSWLAQTDLRN